MTKGSEASAELVLTAPDLDPDDLTRFLGISPTRQWRKGEPTISRAKVLHSEGGWLRSTGREVLDETRGIDVPSQVTRLLTQLRPHSERLMEAKRRFGLRVQLGCVLYVRRNDRPWVHFDSDVVRWLAAFDGAIDIDLYKLT